MHKITKSFDFRAYPDMTISEKPPKEKVFRAYIEAFTEVGLDPDGLLINNETIERLFALTIAEFHEAHIYNRNRKNVKNSEHKLLAIDLDPSGSGLAQTIYTKIKNRVMNTDVKNINTARDLSVKVLSVSICDEDNTCSSYDKTQHYINIQ